MGNRVGSYLVLFLVIIGIMTIFSGCVEEKSSPTVIDDKIVKVKPGMSMPEIIELLGKPYKAKENPMGILVFVYKGEKVYHWILFEEQFGLVTNIESSDSDSFYPSTDVEVIIDDGRIELRRNE